MATGTTVHPPRELCRYFLSNVCRFGDNCVYSHDRSTGQVNNICRYYLQGKCSYGDRCRYDHIRPKPQISTSSQSKPIISNPVSSQQATVSVMRSQPVNGQTTMSYASVCRGNNDTTDTSNEFEQYPLSHSFQSLCPYAEKDGVCEALETGRYCPYVHGDICDLCQMLSLHPTDEQQREQHRIECMQKHEAECEEAFAIQRSQDKTCGVCLEIVWTRDGDKRFGILENCDHIFCLECIRKWRASSNYENKIVKACPECRVKSDFITPAKYWPENDQAKRELINSYKENLQQIHCKFFKRGDGVCPFGSKCFYLHVDKHGQPVQLNPPHRRQRINARGELENFTEILMASVFANEDISRFFDEYDFIFDDEDDEYFDTDDSDENEFRFTDEHNQSDNDNDDDDDDSPSQWH